MSDSHAPVWSSASTERRTRRQELADRLVTAIVVGVFSPGDRLPPERDLARLGSTVLAAGDDAGEQGWW